MIWNKSKQPADPQQGTAAAPKKGGAAAFAKKNWKWLVPVAIVVLAGGWWLLKPKSAKPANVDTSYTEVMPETRDVSNTLSVTGTLNPANTYSVKSLVSGKVLTGSFEEGDIVEEGTVLYTVDSSDATTKVEQAAITLQQAQRSYDKTVDRQYVRAEVAGVVSSLKVGQSVQVTADAVKDKTYEGLVTRVSMKGDTSGGTTTYPVTVRIDETTGLRPGMNANAEIVVAQAKNALTVPNAAIVRGSYVLVRQDSPSAVNADASMSAPEGYVYVKVKTGVSDDNYTQVTSGLSESDTIAYDPSSVSSDSYYDDGGYDYSDGEVIGGTENAADPAEGGEEMLPEETENAEEPAADAEEPAEGIDPAEAGAVVVN